MIVRTCDHCGTEFEAQKSSARFCTATHRVAWNRLQKKPGGTVLRMPARPGAQTAGPPQPSSDELSIESQVRRELGGSVESALGQMCLTAARRIDRREVVGSALGTVLKRLDEMLEKVVAAGVVAEVEADESNPITFLRQRAAGRAG